MGNALFNAAIVPPPVFQAELTSSDAATYDNLGYAVALSGDTALVGDPYKTVGDQGHVGAVYVYTWSGTSWSQQAELSDPDAAGSDYFGASVALSGDTALIGAWGATVNGQGSAGKAYIFTRSGGSWSQPTVLSDPDTTYENYFGTSVALSGDTALIGAPSTTVGGQDYAGVVYIYTLSGGSWSQQTVLHDPNPANGDNFGTSLALSGNTALVGDPNKTVGPESAGAAYVYTGSGASWTQQAQLSASDPSGADHFGASVALSGNTALVGAFDKTVAGQNYAGAAYIYGRSGANWTQQAELSDPDAASGDTFGSIGGALRQHGPGRRPREDRRRRAPVRGRLRLLPHGRKLAPAGRAERSQRSRRRLLRLLGGALRLPRYGPGRRLGQDRQRRGRVRGR